MKDNADLRKLSYCIEDIQVSVNDINKFEVFEDRRHMRSSQVESILIALRAGKHFESPLVVNKIGEKYRVIDGNHRVEAMRQFLSERRSVSLVVRMAVYKNISPAEERNVYTIWSLGIKQTIDDLLNLRKDEIPIYKMLISKHFPVAIYKSRTSNSVPLGLIVRMLYASGNEDKVFAPHSPSRNAIVGIAQRYGDDDAVNIMNFFDVFERAVGGLRDNKFIRPVFCIPAFNIYLLNKPLGADELVERLEKTIADTGILTVLHEHSEQALIQMRDRILEICDRGKKRKMMRGIAKVGSEEPDENNGGMK